MQLFWTVVLGVSLYALIVLILSSRMRDRDPVQPRLDEIESMKAVTPEETKGYRSLNQRLLAPLVQRLFGFLGKIVPTNETQLADLTNKLRAGGSSLDARAYLGRTGFILVLAGTVCAALGLLTGSAAAALEYGLLGALAVFVFARFSLASKITRRKEALEAGMPDILDLLSANVSAGLGFDQALLHVIERADGPLTEEFRVVLREISLGRTRTEALTDMAGRCDVEPLTTFVNAVVQADKLGIPIANVMQTQAEAIRRYRKQRVEEQAAKLPVKILLPLVGFIFPALLVVLLGPAAIMVVDALM